MNNRTDRWQRHGEARRSWMQGRQARHGQVPGAPQAEEIFYPAVKAAMKDKELVPEATVEHASVKDLIAQVRNVEPDGEMYDAKVKVMSEFVKHHVKEEQNEMFPKARKTRLDMVALRDQMIARKVELLAEIGS